MSSLKLDPSVARPARLRDVHLPRRTQYYPSPVDWRNEILYFMLPDRFSDGKETTRRPLPLDPQAVAGVRPPGWQWCRWVESGARWQGGTLKGIQSKLDYLARLGVTTLWIAPVFKQRGHLNDYHGYGIQDFLEVDPHLGTRQDLVALVEAAHGKKMRILLDIVFNHSGHNWDYATKNPVDPPYLPFPEFYRRGPWLDAHGNSMNDHSLGPDDGVWPEELQSEASYTRAGNGSLAGENIYDKHAEFKRTDFAGVLRDFNEDNPDTLHFLAQCYKYWIALTDCDGFRLDTLKHVSLDAARNFCGSIKEYAANLGKQNFFLVGEVGGPEDNADKYQEILGLNLNATLDIGGLRPNLTAIAKGLTQPTAYFNLNKLWSPELGSSRNSGPRHVTILDDHDHVFGQKLRFSCGASSPHQVAAGVAIQLFCLGIPCIYYGTEQAFAGPEPSEQKYLDNFGNNDRYLREAMFGPEHPRKDGWESLGASGTGIDTALPGFGPFGTAGYHCFNDQHPAFVRITALIGIRQQYPVLRYGRQYLRDISIFGEPFACPGAGELIPWSRILDDEEALCVVNGNGTAARGGNVRVSLELNGAPGSSFTVVANTAEAAAGGSYRGAHPVGSQLPVLRTAANENYVEIRDLPPSEALVLMNRM